MIACEYVSIQIYRDQLELSWWQDRNNCAKSSIENSVLSFNWLTKVTWQALQSHTLDEEISSKKGWIFFIKKAHTNEKYWSCSCLNQLYNYLSYWINFLLTASPLPSLSPPLCHPPLSVNLSPHIYINLIFTFLFNSLFLFKIIVNIAKYEQRAGRSLKCVWVLTIFRAKTRFFKN